MVAQRTLTETVQEVVNSIPEHTGKTVQELMETEEGKDLIDEILMKMKEQLDLKRLINQKPINM